MISRMRLPVSRRAVVAVVAAAAVASAAVAGAAVARSGSAVAVAIERTGDAVVVHASAEIAGTLATGWGVLTDYPRYVEFVPGLRTSRIIARDGTEVTVEQKGRAPLWLLDLPVDVVYRITESPPRRLHSHAATDDGATLDSDYTLTPDAGGLRIDYVGRLVAPRGVLGGLREAAAERPIVAHFRALAAEIARQSKADGSAPADPMVGAR